MKTFVSENSIIRRIWGSMDVTLFIFAGAAAEFALNKQVDWLYFTGKLPADPIGRLFSTLQYSRQIIFSDESNAIETVDRINSIHEEVETKRGRNIPAWAYKDVLYMLIHYSVAAYELLERKLTVEEKDEVVDVFRKVGIRMNIDNIPVVFDEWVKEYESILQNDIEYSGYTKDLFRQYKKHLGSVRYWLLLEVQRMLVPVRVNELLRLGHASFGKMLMPGYKVIRKLNMQRPLISILVPGRYKVQLRGL